MRNTRLSNNQGFTLIEIILVLAILGILSLMAVPSITQVLSGTSQISTDTATTVVNSASKQYEAEYGEAATNVDQLESSKMTKLNKNEFEYNYNDKTGMYTASKKMEP